MSLVLGHGEVEVEVYSIPSKNICRNHTVRPNDIPDSIMNRNTEAGNEKFERKSALEAHSGGEVDEISEI